MYTQCPECSVAFRITADVLRKAAGKVRCGGCGAAFNALENLSEDKPVARAAHDPDSQLPELTPEVESELESDTPPEAISAEQSAALLKTLDQLAGSDIRIEDTGVEWRVLDDDGSEIQSDEPARATDDAAATHVESDDPELIAVTESLNFIVSGNGDDGEVDELLEEAPTPVDEFLTETPPEVDAPEIFEEMRFDDNTPLPDDFDLDAPSPAPDPPALEPPPNATGEDIQIDLELGDPDEWEDLLGEVGAATAAQTKSEPGPDLADDVEASGEHSVDDLVVPEEAAGDAAKDRPPDLDTQFIIQAEAMGIDLSGMHTAVGEVESDESDKAVTAAEADPAEVTDAPEGALAGTSIDEDLINAAFESEAAVHELPGPEIDKSIEFDLEMDPAGGKALVDELEGPPVDEQSLAISFDDGAPGPKESIETDLEHVIPEMTEEEKTINMLIDRDLLSVAVEDENGFASTIVQVQPDRKVDREIDNIKQDADEEAHEEHAPAARNTPKSQLFETIIMEGEEVRDELIDKRREKNRRLVEQARQAAEAEEVRRPRRLALPKAGMIAAVVLLALILILQILHKSRDALATVPAFNDSVGSLYRIVGKPLTPAWDITGWRFEATKGSTDENEELLTIYSRIGNRSVDALPYPLVHVSLTGRFEDIIGSRVLEPGEYLPSEVDPQELVPAGSTFNAVIAIESPAAEATGFKLNVCYRLAGGRLRCAIEDFK